MTDISRFDSLRKWNLGLTALHAVQAVLIFAVFGSFSIAVNGSFPTGPPGTRIESPERLFDLPIGPMIAIFLALAALDHLLTSTVFRNTYERDLGNGINRFRWMEYSVSSTIMVVLIGSYSGITEITAIIAIIGTNVAMILFGWLQEKMNPPGRSETTMMPFWFGCVAGIAPWIALAVNILGAETVPGFVFGILIVQAIFFFSFALNQWLQYREIGKWSDYLYGEKAYLVLSLGAKSLLAWQIYGGSQGGT
jgi:hypothetical protein